MKFKELFKLGNTLELLSQLNAVAYEYYTRLLESGIDDMENLKYFLLCLDRVYQEGYESPLRDNEYDEIHELYLDNGGEVIRGDMSSTDKAVHAYPDLKGTIRKVHFITEEERLTNGKVKSQKSLETWLLNVVRTLRDAGVYDGHMELGFYTKFDGLSVILEIENGRLKSAITRGDRETGEGQNKTNVFQITNFDRECDTLNTSKFGMKCEALVPKSMFDAYNKRFGKGKFIDERTAATSIMNNDSPSPAQLQYLTLMPLMVEIDGVEYPLPVMDDSVPDTVRNTFDWLDDEFPAMILDLHIKSFSVALAKISTAIDMMTKAIENIDYPVDGIVIRILNENYRRVLGRNVDDCVNNWERAYKFPPARSKTVLREIEQEIGLLGKVSFTAKVEPVKLKNKTIKSISLGSLDRFKSLNLAIGDEVIVQYDIIPYLTIDNTCKRSGNEPVKVIDHCPHCGCVLAMVPELSCINLECPSRIVGKIYNYCAKIGIEGIGEETVATLYHHGLLKSIPDIYRLESQTKLLKHIDGFGSKSVKKMIDAINAVEKVNDSVLLGALGIPSVGRKMFEKILTVIPFNELVIMEPTYESEVKLTTIPGIKHKTARRILEGLRSIRYELNEILKHLTVRKATSYKMKICFTKIRDHEFEKYLMSQGIGIADDVTKEVAYLVAGSNTSSKVTKAHKLNIPIIDIETAYKKFGYSK